MKEIHIHLLRACYGLNAGMKSKNFNTLLCIVAFTLFSLVVDAQTNNYFGVTGVLNGNAWSTNVAGPYTLPLNTTGGAIINFGNNATITGSTATIAGINATADVNWTNGGTLSTGGITAPVFVANGKILNLSQIISTSAGTGFNKMGNGILAMSAGSLYPGGFTLSNGTIVIGGVNALGGNNLQLNGGIVAANANRDLSGKYPGGIAIGGDVQFGDINAPAIGFSSIIFSDAVSLGTINRVLTLGGAGNISFGGVISNSGINGISFAANINGTGIFDITNTGNSFTGPVVLSSGNTRFSGDGCFGHPSNTIEINGGQLLNNGSFTIANTRTIKLGNNVGTGINTTAGILTIDAVITDKTTSGSFVKSGTGTLILTNANTYTGVTNIAVNGGTLQLNHFGGNTLPLNNSIVVNGGSLRISTNQSCNDLSLVNGNLAIDDGVILTINGTFDYNQPSSITLTGSGRIAYGIAGILKYSGNIAKNITAAEFPSIGGPANVIMNNSAGVTLPALLVSRTITGSLQLSAGNFAIGAGAALDLNGASLINGGGYISGSGTSDLIVRGNTGGAVTLPTNSNILFRNITVAGTRSLAMNGIDNIALSGLLSIALGATYDSGGESQVTQNGSGSIIIDGRFITRDLQGFSGANSSIPGILPLLNNGCTVEYALNNGNSQAVSSRSDYRNLTFSGNGMKMIGGPFNPAGTVYITGAAILDAGNHTFGDINTNLSMDGGRFKLSGTNNPQPHMSGVYNISGGVVEFACNSISGQTIKNTTYQNIEVTGKYVGNSNGNITLNNNGTFTVKSGASFEINDNSIMGVPATGGQTVTVENDAVFLCGNNQGFNGYTPSLTNNSAIHSNITNITLTKGIIGSTVNYTRAGDQPITMANNMGYCNLILSGTGIKTAPINTLSIDGNLSNTGSGTFAHNNGRVLFTNLVNPQTISSVSLQNFNFYDFQNNSVAGLNINSNIGISNRLALSGNSVLHVNSGDIRLLSTALNTAMVAQIPPSALINYNGSGRFIVERYYPALRSWRLITSPLSAENTNTTIFSEWQNNGVFTPGIGSFVTGPNPNNTVNGLDYSNLNNYSLKTFQNNGYINIGNTLVPLSNNLLSAANIGYFMFVRGDRNRSPDNTVVPNKNVTTLSSRGKLQTGTQTFPGITRLVDGPRLFNLVGNPYASPVDFNFISRNNAVKRFIVWDPKLNTVGGFVTVDDYDNDGLYTISPPSLGGQDINIQSSQAFFFETDAIGPSSITFNENCKSVVNNPGMFRPVEVTPSFAARLYLVTADGTLVLADGNLAEFSNIFNAGVDLQDALKFGNINETFGLFRNNTPIAIERRPAIATDDTLYYLLTRSTQRNYQLLFEHHNFDPLVSAFLEDDYTGAKTPLSATTPTSYQFAITADVLSAAPQRFRVIFSKAAAGTLAINNSTIKVLLRQEGILVEWTVENSVDIVQYELWKSADGINFHKIYTTGDTGINGLSQTYHWMDAKPSTGDNFYRIASIDAKGAREYGRIIHQSFSNKTNNVSIITNPTIDGMISLSFINAKAGTYYAKLINNLGQTIFRKIILHSSSNKVENIRIGTLLPAGVYHLQLASPVNRKTSLQLLVK
ncbi:MAG: autotransporter-associated beta strand repeat-containing protein [Ferruginibacter sp.]